jgi:hypothetical protein
MVKVIKLRDHVLNKYTTVDYLENRRREKILFVPKLPSSLAQIVPSMQGHRAVSLVESNRTKIDKKM